MLITHAVCTRLLFYSILLLYPQQVSLSSFAEATTSTMSAADLQPSSSVLPPPSLSPSSSSFRPRLAHSVNRGSHHCECHNWVINHASSSPYSSPHSASLPSPPESPPLDPYADIDLDSISSFPSVSSSVFFSSSAGSPHSQPRQLDHEHDGLIIPSLTLPSKLQQPTPLGQTLGDLSFLLVGPKGGGKTSLAEFLADSDDIVDASDWEDIDGGRILHASTDWIEEHDPHGLERFEGSENVSFTELDGFDYTENVSHVCSQLAEAHNLDGYYISAETCGGTHPQTHTRYV